MKVKLLLSAPADHECYAVGGTLHGHKSGDVIEVDIDLATKLIADGVGEKFDEHGPAAMASAIGKQVREQVREALADQKSTADHTGPIHIQVTTPGAENPAKTINPVDFYRGVVALGASGSYHEAQRVLGDSGKPGEDSGHAKAMRGYLNHVVARMVEIERKSLTDAQVVAVDQAGGVLVPTEMSSIVLDNAIGSDRLLSLMRRIPMGAPQITIPSRFISAQDTAAARHGGIQAYQIDESQTKTVSRLGNLREVTLNLHEMAVAVPISNRLLKYSPISVPDLVASFVRSELNFRMQDLIFRGGGTGEALGFANSGNAALISVTRDTTSQVRSNDVRAMWARRFDRGGSPYVWLVEQSVETEFLQMGTMPREGGTAAIPMLLPGQYNAASPMTILGREVISTDFCAALGTAGDIVLIDPSQYILGVPSSDPVSFATSSHVRFLNNEEVLRWTTEYDGRPWWPSTFTPRSGGDTRSPFIVLAA